MSNFTRRDLLGVAAGLAAMAWARPVSADEPAPFELDEVIDSGHRFFGGLLAISLRRFKRRSADGVCPTATSWVRKRPPRSWADFATAKARCTRATPATRKSFGKVLRSVSTQEPTATGR